MVYDAAEGTPDDSPAAYVVNEWIEGQTLTERLASGPLPEREARAVVRRLAEGVAEAHRVGLAVGGLTPDHVVLRPGGLVGLLAVPAAEGTVPGDVAALGALLELCLTGRRGDEPGTTPPVIVQPDLAALVRGPLTEPGTALSSVAAMAALLGDRRAPGTPTPPRGARRGVRERLAAQAARPPRRRGRRHRRPPRRATRRGRAAGPQRLPAGPRAGDGTSGAVGEDTAEDDELEWASSYEEDDRSTTHPRPRVAPPPAGRRAAAARAGHGRGRRLVAGQQRDLRGQQRRRRPGVHPHRCLDQRRRDRGATPGPRPARRCRSRPPPSTTPSATAPRERRRRPAVLRRRPGDLLAHADLPRFGRLRQPQARGRGVLYDLGSEQSLSGSPSPGPPGGTVEVRTGDGADGDLDSYAVGAQGDLTGSADDLAFAEPVTTATCWCGSRAGARRRRVRRRLAEVSPVAAGDRSRSGSTGQSRPDGGNAAPRLSVVPPVTNDQPTPGPAVSAPGDPVRPPRTIPPAEGHGRARPDHHRVRAGRLHRRHLRRRANLHPGVRGSQFGGALMTTTEVENFPGSPRASRARS